MEMNKNLINNAINDLTTNINEFNTLHYFLDELPFNEDNINTEYSIVKFLDSYLSMVYYLKENQTNEFKIYLRWYETKGKNNLKRLTQKIDYFKINKNNLFKMFMQFDVLSEQVIYEHNLDELLDLLIDTPIKICNKLKEWDCVELDNNNIRSESIIQYDNNDLKPKNLNSIMPAHLDVQAYLFI